MSRECRCDIRERTGASRGVGRYTQMALDRRRREISCLSRWPRRSMYIRLPHNIADHIGARAGYMRRSLEQGLQRETSGSHCVLPNRLDRLIGRRILPGKRLLDPVEGSLQCPVALRHRGSEPSRRTAGARKGPSARLIYYSEICLKCRTHTPRRRFGCVSADFLFDGSSAAWCFFGRLPR